MFENIKTGFINRKLFKLSNKIRDIDENYNIKIEQLLPNITKKIKNIKYSNNTIITYNLVINQIKYSLICNSDYYKPDYINITIEDVTIAQCSIIDGTTWFHSIPKNMLNKIKEDNKVIDKYYKTITEYMQFHNTIKKTKWIQEKEELNEIFK